MALLTATSLMVMAFVVMEPVTAATHRFVMHGVGERLHRSHHRRPGSHRWEANDWFPVAFSSIVMAALWLGFNRDGFGGLVAISIGVTGYGAAYALVHDVYIHRRLRWFGDRRIAVLARLADAHRIHHLYGGAPYGMLLPLVPAELRDRASRATSPATPRTPTTPQTPATTATPAHRTPASPPSRFV